MKDWKLNTSWVVIGITDGFGRCTRCGEVLRSFGGCSHCWRTKCDKYREYIEVLESENRRLKEECETDHT